MQILKLIIYSFLAFSPLLIQAQKWVRSDQIRLKNTPTSYAADFQNNFYLGFSDGSLIKYNSDGILQESYSLSNASAISLIDVQNNLKPFLFYFDNQQITVLDRFSSVPKNYHLSDLGIQLSMMTCPSPDGDFWVLENNPQRLKKINALRKVIILEVQVTMGETIKKMQAHQNLLLIADETGIHFFDQYGGFLKSMSINNLLNFQITDGFLYVFTRKSILRYSLSRNEILDTIDFPDTRSDAILKLGDIYLLIDNKNLAFYRFH